MRIVSTAIAGFCFFLLFLAPTGVRADESCPHLSSLSLPLLHSDEGYLVPITVQGTPRYFLLELESPYARILKTVADELQLPRKQVPSNIKIGHDGKELTEIAVADTIAFNNIPRQHVEMIVDPFSQYRDPRIAGVIGINILMPFDIELDLAGNRLGLFLPNHCPGADAVVYWPNWGVAAVPFKTDPTGQIVIPMTLDGTRVEVALATSEEKSRISFLNAHMLLGFEKTDPALKPAAIGWGKPTYRYPFKTLSSGDVSIANPEIYVLDNNDQGRPCGGVAGRLSGTMSNTFCYGGGDVLLGNQETRQLRFFFSLKEKMVYFTLAPPAQGQ